LLHCAVMISGHATASGTARYRDRFPQLRDANHFRRSQPVPGAGELWLSSIGVGTYLGEPDDDADREYTAAIDAALRSGINLLDTAINYRHQRSERNIGAALKNRIKTRDLQRDEVLVCTKAGYLSFDANLPPDPRSYFMREYIEPGILDPKELSGGMHCMAPAYLENQIERSRRNLGLETIDVFYLHNPESQLSDVSREVFNRRLRTAFTMLESKVEAGEISFYGMATWGAFRLPEGARDAINLADVVELAREVAGEKHHFRFIQLPFNLAMPEAYAHVNQRVGNEKKSLLAAARELGLVVIGSATLHQGQLTHGLPQFVANALGTESDAGSAIQFSRSAPGLTTSLVGMGHIEHVKENLKVAEKPPAEAEAWRKLFREK